MLGEGESEVNPGLLERLVGHDETRMVHADRASRADRLMNADGIVWIRVLDPHVPGVSATRRMNHAPSRRIAADAEQREVDVEVTADGLEERGAQAGVAAVEDGST